MLEYELESELESELEPEPELFWVSRKESLVSFFSWSVSSLFSTKESPKKRFWRWLIWSSWATNCVPFRPRAVK